ncbi:EF-hand domain-containing protein 1-like [Condylostylus longicornis]|uniref:EF-hand domain-containing protein 1-like n=1 Tax=Condylostylus longicornis TaxID=2530218 RepID=UPI00244DE06A|nr:EF-hand domain-containing protein 1-like [Condylostylus longicornis]
MEKLFNCIGLDCISKSRLNHHISHSNFFYNGHAFQRIQPSGVGNESSHEASINFKKSEEAILYDPILTYGKTRNNLHTPFKPNFVKFDKIILTFFAFFKPPGRDPDSSNETMRPRRVNILYFLADDSITVFEPAIMNSGLLQGRLVRRGKVSKNSIDYYSWKDLNIGIDIEINDFIFHITDCDQFTKDFLKSQGVDLNKAEICTSFTSLDNISTENKNEISKQPAKKDDKLKKFLQFNGKVLKFDVLLYEPNLENGNNLTYTMLYFLEDDTIALKELEENRKGRDNFPLFLKRSKVPKNREKGLCKTNPGTFLVETTDGKSDNYYQPKDFVVGETINVYGRRFLLLDCDKFTRAYYKDLLHINQPDKIHIHLPEKKIGRQPLPEYLGLGTPEDSLASYYALRPKTPRKDLIKYLKNTNKVLRYLCVLDSPHPEDSVRKFILQYNLADDSISITEPPLKNSGIIGGKFLNRCKIKIPKCDPKSPTYYTPKNIIIGSILEINSHRFRITGADLFVYRYMQNYPELFTDEMVRMVQEHLLASPELNDKIKKEVLSPTTQVKDNNCFEEAN